MYIAVCICAFLKFLFTRKFVWIVSITWLFIVGLVVIAGWIFELINYINV
jgi:hypothetical protein